MCSLIGVLLITALSARASHKPIWSGLTDDLYEDSIAIATLAAIVAFWFIKDSQRHVVEQLIAENVIDIKSDVLSHELELHDRRLHSRWFALLLLAFWVLSVIALRLGRITIADFDWYGIADFVVGRGLWLSIFAWFFWWSMVGVRMLERIVRIAGVRPHLWTATGDGGIAVFGTCILALSSPLFISTILGLIWLLPPFNSVEGYEGAKAVAILPELAVAVTLTGFFVPCVWAIHKKLAGYKRQKLDEISLQLRDSHDLFNQTAKAEEAVAVSERLQALVEVRAEIHNLPVWPFARNAGLLFAVVQIGAVGATVLKAYEDYEKYLRLIRQILTGC